MKLPVIEGIIERRILINFAVDETVLANFLPKPFRPKLIGNKGLAGICLIRLKNIRPLGFPEIISISSENAAHRIAVEWTENGQIKQGVYVPRRDSNSLLNHWMGGHIFPGIHHLAQFNVQENNNAYQIEVTNKDTPIISISAKETTEFNLDSIFKNLESASDFFKNGAIGFSPNKSAYDGIELKTSNWKVEPLKVETVDSSFFQNTSVFPKGSVCFDNALLMRNIKHTWNNYEKCPDS